jgi:hypothetical protein
MISYTLDNRSLILGLGSAAAVTVGSATALIGMTGSFSGQGQSKWPLVRNGGLMLFMLGWIAFIVSMVLDKGGTTGIVGAVAAAMTVMGSGLLLWQRTQKNPSTMYSSIGLLLFVGGWYTLAGMVSMNDTSLSSFDSRKAAWVFSGATLVVLSMVGIIPFQRANNFVDGPGYAMFGIGWVLVAIGHAIQK